MRSLPPFAHRRIPLKQRTETSLIERFLYPKLGPGQMWEAVAREVAARGGEVHLQHRVVGIERSGFTVTAVTVRDESTGAERRVACDYFLSTLPVHDLAAMLLPEDERVAHVARRLPYRDFMTVGLLLRRMSVPGKRPRDAAANGMPAG